jgi:hypothetical protein
VKLEVADLDHIVAEAAPHQHEHLASQVLGLIAAAWALEHVAPLSAVQPASSSGNDLIVWPADGR